MAVWSGRTIRTKKEPMRRTKADVGPLGKFALRHSKGLGAARLVIPMGVFNNDPALRPVLSDTSVAAEARTEHDPLSKVNRLDPCVLKIDEQCIYRQIQDALVSPIWVSGNGAERYYCNDCHNSDQFDRVTVSIGRSVPSSWHRITIPWSFYGQCLRTLGRAQ